MNRWFYCDKYGRYRSGDYHPPQSEAVWIGSDVTLSVITYGNEPMCYLWLKDNVVINDANAVSYTLDAFSAADAGEYCCFVSNAFGATLSEVAVLTVEGSM